jgi:hypothetical protein
MPNPPKPQPKPGGGKKNLPPWLKDKDGKPKK